MPRRPRAASEAAQAEHIYSISHLSHCAQSGRSIPILFWPKWSKCPILSHFDLKWDQNDPFWRAPGSLKMDRKPETWSLFDSFWPLFQKGWKWVKNDQKVTKSLTSWPFWRIPGLLQNESFRLIWLKMTFGSFWAQNDSKWPKTHPNVSKSLPNWTIFGSFWKNYPFWPKITKNALNRPRTCALRPQIRLTLDPSPGPGLIICLNPGQNRRRARQTQSPKSEILSQLREALFSKFRKISKIFRNFENFQKFRFSKFLKFFRNFENRKFSRKCD